jgi:hypothetical protein
MDQVSPPLLNQSSAYPIIYQYINRVAALAQGQYIGIHFKYIPRGKENEYIPIGKKRPPCPGNAFASADIDSAARQALFWAREAHRPTDVFLAMGSQPHCGDHAKKGNWASPRPTAIREKKSVSACRCLYIDTDVKDEKEDPNGECYRTIAEMDAKIKQFLAKTGLPRPSVVVNSGRGVSIFIGYLINSFIPLTGRS